MKIKDLTRFLIYLIAALQTIAPAIGEVALDVFQSPQSQPPSAESILTTLLNDVATLAEDFALVLDDYHVVDARAVENRALP